MNKTIIYSISEYLTKAVNSSYKKAKKDVVKNIRKYITTGKTFDDTLPSYLSIDYSATDNKFISNFEKECFTVACVGTYELEEKMKDVAKEILELPETDTRDRFKLFVKESQDLLNQYIPDGDKIPPAGWLKTNLQTAVNSSYNASQWQKLHDPAVKDLYPAYKYKTREDSHVRNEHAVLNNSVYLADDPIWKVIYPPNGWNCRCYINYLSTDDIKEPGNSVIYPSDQERKETVKKGRISSDFARNSGIDGHIFDKWVSAKLKDMPDSAVSEIRKLVNYNTQMLRSTNYDIQVKQGVVKEGTSLREYMKDIDIDEKLWEAADSEIKTLRYVNGGGSIWDDDFKILTLDVSRHQSNLFKFYDVCHELSHIYHIKNKIITPEFISEEFGKFYNEVKKIFDDNYKSGDLLRENYKNYRDKIRKSYDVEYGEYKFLTSISGDILASLTEGKYGIGHDLSYWNKITTASELFTNSSVINFVGNKFLEKEFPLIYKKILNINKYYG